MRDKLKLLLLYNSYTCVIYKEELSSVAQLPGTPHLVWFKLV